MSSRRRSSPDETTLDGSRPDRNGFGRERVAEIQRARMLAAMVEQTVEHGAGKVAVAHVVARSGVSRRTFYELFEDREDCFLAAFDDAVERVVGEVVPAYDGAGSWREKMRAGLVALLSILDGEFGIARLLIVESLAAGPGALDRRSLVLERLIAAVDEGRRAGRSGSEPPPLTAEGVVGAVLAVLHGRLADSHPQPLIELANPLMGMIVLPYLGLAPARRELERAVPRARVISHVTHGDPLRELDMRLTYRTVRVLMAVAAGPGSSNRTIGERAEIADQGQTSKLLARLGHLGLIENSGAGGVRGEPNAWTLTQNGWKVHDAISRPTPSA